MKETLAKTTAQAFKEITLADIYDEIAKGKQRQEEDFRYLTQRIDTQIGQVRQEIGQINQRLDTIMQMLVDIAKQKSA